MRRAQEPSREAQDPSANASALLVRVRWKHPLRRAAVGGGGSCAWPPPHLEGLMRPHVARASSPSFHTGFHFGVSNVRPCQHPPSRALAGQPRPPFGVQNTGHLGHTAALADSRASVCLCSHPMPFRRGRTLLLRRARAACWVCITEEYNCPSDRDFRLYIICM